MQETIIKLEDISKDYGRKNILKHVDLSIEKGASIAFAGHNGAGKSTLLKIIGGLVTVTSGLIHREQGLRFAYIPEHFPKMILSPVKYLSHMGRLEGREKEEVEREAEELLRKFFMEGMKDIPMCHLSKGSLQKVGVIQALLTTPDVLLMDEPLSGQDMDSQRTFLYLLDTLRKRQVTFLMSCHEKFLMHRVADTVYEIVDGELQEKDLGDYGYQGYHTMLFEGGQGGKLPPEARAVRTVGGQIKITVPQEESRLLILKMLNQGWNLQEMYHEDDE